MGMTGRIGELETRVDMIEIERKTEKEVYGHPFRHFLRLDDADPDKGLVLSREMAFAMRRFVAEEVAKVVNGSDDEGDDELSVVECVRCEKGHPSDETFCVECVELAVDVARREATRELIEDMRYRAARSTGTMRTVLITESNRMEAEFLPRRNEKK